MRAQGIDERTLSKFFHITGRELPNITKEDLDELGISQVGFLLLCLYCMADNIFLFFLMPKSARDRSALGPRCLIPSVH